MRVPGSTHSAASLHVLAIAAQPVPSCFAHLPALPHTTTPPSAILVPGIFRTNMLDNVVGALAAHPNIPIHCIATDFDATEGIAACFGLWGALLATHGTALSLSLPNGLHCCREPRYDDATQFHTVIDASDIVADQPGEAFESFLLALEAYRHAGLDRDELGTRFRTGKQFLARGYFIQECQLWILNYFHTPLWHARKLLRAANRAEDSNTTTLDTADALIATAIRNLDRFFLGNITPQRSVLRATDGFDTVEYGHRTLVGSKDMQSLWKLWRDQLVDISAEVASIRRGEWLPWNAYDWIEYYLRTAPTSITGCTLSRLIPDYVTEPGLSYFAPDSKYLADSAFRLLDEYVRMWKKFSADALPPDMATQLKHVIAPLQILSAQPVPIMRLSDGSVALRLPANMQILCSKEFVGFLAQWNLPPPIVRPDNIDLIIPAHLITRNGTTTPRADRQAWMELFRAQLASDADTLPGEILPEHHALWKIFLNSLPEAATPHATNAPARLLASIIAHGTTKDFLIQTIQKHPPSCACSTEVTAAIAAVCSVFLPRAALATLFAEPVYSTFAATKQVGMCIALSAPNLAATAVNEDAWIHAFERARLPSPRRYGNSISIFIPAWLLQDGATPWPIATTPLQPLTDDVIAEFFLEPDQIAAYRAAQNSAATAWQFLWDDVLRDAQGTPLVPELDRLFLKSIPIFF